MQIVEFTDPAQADISDINLIKVDWGYYYNWNYNNIKYSVGFERVQEPFELPDGKEVEANGFILEFVGPKGTRPTDLAGDTSLVVYKKMMLAIRKLLETENVDYFAFAGQTGKMDRLYDRFVKTFLGDRFTWYDSVILMNKEFLKLINLQHPSSMKSVEDKLSQTQQMRQQKLLSQKQQDDKARIQKKTSVNVEQEPAPPPARGLFGKPRVQTT